MDADEAVNFLVSIIIQTIKGEENYGSKENLF